jgi:prophage DNA circulation protein
MRRTLSVVAVVAALLVGAACSSERADVARGAARTGAPDGGSASDSSPTPSAGAVAPVQSPAGGNAAEVCAAALETSTESATAYVSALVKSLEAATTGDTNKIAEAQRNAEAVLDSWSAELREQAAKATDERLKTVLIEVADEVSRMEADIESVDEARLYELELRLSQLCAA